MPHSPRHLRSKSPAGAAPLRAPPRPFPRPRTRLVLDAAATVPPAAAPLAVHHSLHLQHHPPLRARRLREPRNDRFLPDEAYVKHHLRMRRRERMFTSTDRERLALDVDVCRSKLESLLLADWKRHLSLVVLYSGPAEKARGEAVAELRATLLRYARWKLRADQLLAELAQNARGHGCESDDERDVAELRRRWRRQRALQHGPVVRVHLVGRTLVIDPLRGGSVEPA